MSDKVELIPAHFWTCPDCGTDQFERCVTLEVSEEELQEMKSDLGIQPWQEGVFLTDPDNVTCRNCNRTFETVGFQADADA